MERCPWCLGHPLLTAYHDAEWGVPVHDERQHFEFLVLEAAQAGLSWLTVLKKREAYRARFAGFDPAAVATWGEAEIADALQDAGIIRNRAKVRAAVNNAARFLEVQAEFGSFDAWLWRFVGGVPRQPEIVEERDLAVTNALSDEVSMALSRRGFKFVGSTVICAHLHAVGVINGHITRCFRHAPLAAADPNPGRAGAPTGRPTNG